jgi:glutamyl-tRNA synthetase/glutamyl-Q tRNA(Asp) synthetase
MRAHGLTEAPAGDELPYPGTCRARRLGEGPGRGIRVVMPDRAVCFDDLRHGAVRQCPAAQAGDLLLRDRHGNWTYQFCVVVDDHLQGVNLVIRGDDLLDSTGRQILLGEMLGRTTPPVFLLHPLLFGPLPGVKLSKRDHAAGLDQLRDAGYSRERVLGEAAFRTGLIPSAREIGPADLATLFQ